LPVGRASFTRAAERLARSQTRTCGPTNCRATLSSLPLREQVNSFPVMGETGSISTSSVVQPVTLSHAVLRPIVFSRPLRLVEPTSWVSHIPFAFWLVEALAPHTVVELGTMSGNSFAALAQGIQTLGLDAACYAVDTWKGDPQTGFYGEEVFEEWSAFHDRHFGAFSRVVRSTFDEALTKFEDGSVDLLHIDGFHTYEAVRHDFESWLPKLSPRAVVLLHDVNVRELDFGVWQLWEELKDRFPCFEFLHGHGLGVVGVGRELPSALRWLFERVSSDGQSTYIVRQFFGTLGEALVGQRREIAKDAETERFTAELNARLTESAVLRSERDTSRLELAAERSRADRAESATSVLRAELEVAHADRTTLDQALLQARDTIAELSRENAAHAARHAALVRELDVVHSSKSWRWTEPLRNARRSPGGWLRRLLARHPRRSGDAVAVPMPPNAAQGPAESAPLEPPVPVVLSVSGHASGARSDAHTKTIICLSHVVPTPPRAGNEYRIHRLLTHFRRSGYRVVIVVSPLSEAVSGTELDGMAGAYGNVVVCERNGHVRFNLKDGPDVLSVLNGRQTQDFAAILGELEPITNHQADLLVLDRVFCHDTMIAVLVHLQTKLKPCLVLAEYVWMTRALPLLDADVLTAVDTIDVFSTKKEKVTTFGIPDWDVSPGEEAKRLARAKLILAIQREEARILTELAPERPIVIAGVDFDYVSSNEWPSQPVAFCVGSDNPMNRLGLRDFLRFAWPLILNAVPDARLAVAGKLGRVVPCGTRGVDILGHVEDLSACYARARVVVNPAAAGTGLKVKTVEALSHLRPIVAWPNGVDGLPPDVAPFVPAVEDWLEFAERVSGWLRTSRPAFDDYAAALIQQQLSADYVYADVVACLSRLFAEAGELQAP
jgi:hypothetical protein